MPETFADRLRLLRERAGLTQAQLALRASLGVVYVSRLETGAKTGPSWDVVQRLAQALGCRTDEFRAVGPRPADLARRAGHERVTGGAAEADEVGHG